MKHFIAIAAIVAMPAFAFADIEDNTISIDNSGTAEAYGLGVTVDVIEVVDVDVDFSNANAAGVNMNCLNGTSCRGNDITIDNSGEAKAYGSAVAAGVNMRSE